MTFAFTCLALAEIFSENLQQGSSVKIFNRGHPKFKTIATVNRTSCAADQEDAPS